MLLKRIGDDKTIYVWTVNKKDFQEDLPKLSFKNADVFYGATGIRFNDVKGELWKLVEIDGRQYVDMPLYEVTDNSEDPKEDKKNDNPYHPGPI